MPVSFTLPTLPEIPGDPAGMRALAASLRTDATPIAVVATSLKAPLDAVEVVGPAADRCVRLAERLADTAALLERSASEVEAAQRERERRLAEMREEALAAQREALRR